MSVRHSLSTLGLSALFCGLALFGWVALASAATTLDQTVTALNPDITSNPQVWDSIVTLQGYDETGAADALGTNFANIGVKGGVEDHGIDFYRGSGTTETIEVLFTNLVSGLQVEIGLNTTVSGQHQTGTWTAYDINDNPAGSGVLKEANASSSPIAGWTHWFTLTTTADVARLVIEATDLNEGSPPGSPTVDPLINFRKITYTDTGVSSTGNVAPVAANDAVTTNEDTPLSGDVFIDNGSGVDSDANSDPFTVTEVEGSGANVGTQITLPSGASLTLSANGAFTYMPALNWNGADSFTYKISDATLASNAATVSVTVNAVNDAPIARSDKLITSLSTPRTIDPLINDTDVENDPLSVVSFTSGANGTVTAGAGSQLTYTANTGYTGTDSFTYTLSDGTAQTVGSVSVTVASSSFSIVNLSQYDGPLNPDATSNPQVWNSVTTLQGYDENGAVDALGTSTANIGVKGGPTAEPDPEINYYPASGTSEKIVLTFSNYVQDVDIEIGLRTGITNEVETGKWTAYDANGQVLTWGLLDHNIASSEVIVGWTYWFTLGVGQPIASLEIEATDFNNGSPPPSPTTKPLVQFRKITYVDTGVSTSGGQSGNALPINKESYHYDALGRLVSVVQSNGQAMDYTYDPAGNRTQTVTRTASVFTTASTASVTEGASIDLVISRVSASPGNVTVNYTTYVEEATPNVDYTPVTSSVVFLPGDNSKNITINTTPDSTYELDEPFGFRLSGGTDVAFLSDRSIVMINNDDAVPSFSVDDVTGQEGVSDLAFTVSLSNPSILTHEVDYSTSNGTSAEAADFTPISGTLTFLPGEVSKPVTVTVVDDLLQETVDLMALDLVNATNGATFAKTTGVGTINDNEGNVTLTLTGAWASEQGQTLYGYVTRSGPATELTHQVTWASILGGSAEAGVDYTSQSGQVIFTPTGNDSQSFTIPVTDDAIVDADETVFLSISSPSAAATIGGTGTTVATIIDDDFPTTDPVAVDDPGYSMLINKSQVLDVLANDIDNDPSQGTLTVTAVTQPNIGSVSLSGGVVTFSSGGVGGITTFTYTMVDGTSPSKTATVTVTINDPAGGNQ